MAKLVAAQYALGLFELALETSQFDIISGSLTGLKEIAADDEFRLVTQHPQITDDEKYSILKSCVPAEAPDEVFGFLRLLVERGRIAILSEIINEYIKLVDQRESILRARVVSAKKLEESELARVSLMLESRFKKKVKLEEEIDSSVIAGFKVYVGGDLIDTSVKKDIDDIRSLLLESV